MLSAQEPEIQSCHYRQTLLPLLLRCLLSQQVNKRSKLGVSEAGWPRRRMCLTNWKTTPRERESQHHETTSQTISTHQETLSHQTCFLISPTYRTSSNSINCTKLNMPGLTSAAGILGFLYDTEPELKVFALETLNEEIDTVWTEVAGSVAQMYVIISSSCTLT